MPSGSTTGLTLIIFASPTFTERFFTIIRAGCLVPGSGRRSSAGRCAIFCSTRFNPARWSGIASSTGQRCRASRFYCVLRAERRLWPTLPSAATARTLACVSLVTPIRPEYVGVSLVEGLVPAAKQAIPKLWDLLSGSALIALGGERTIGMGTKPEGSVLIYAGLKTHDDTARQSLEEASGPDQRVAWFHANFEGWGELWDPLFREAVSMVWRPLLVCPSNQHWEPKPNVTLIGDAAHVIPPYAGEGVNMAMLDALLLSKLLLSEKSSSGAIATYEAEMFARMEHMAADTMANTKMFYSPDASDRVVALFRSFGAAEAAPPAAEA